MKELNVENMKKALLDCHWDEKLNNLLVAFDRMHKAGFIDDDVYSQFSMETMFWHLVKEDDYSPVTGLVMYDSDKKIEM